LPNLPKPIKVKPATFLMLVFNSPYCSACHAMAPTVQALQRSLKPNLTVLSIDRTQSKNDALANQYTVTSTPTFILFSPCGKPLYQMRDKLYPKTLTQQITQHVQSPLSKKAGC
jgi:thioredoxin-related protein